MLIKKQKWVREGTLEKTSDGCARAHLIKLIKSGHPVAHVPLNTKSWCTPRVLTLDEDQGWFGM